MGTDLKAQRVDKSVQKLKEQKARTTAEIVRFGKLLATEKASLPHGTWGTVLERVGMSDRSAMRLITIASNPVLANPAHVPDLPDHASTLDILARLPKPQLEAALADGRVHHAMSRADAEALKSDGPAVPSAGDPLAGSPEVSDAVSRAVSDGGAGDPATRAPENPTEAGGDDSTDPDGSPGGHRAGSADLNGGPTVDEPPAISVEGSSVTAVAGEQAGSKPDTPSGKAGSTPALPDPSASAPVREAGSEPADPEDTSPSRAAAEGERAGPPPRRPAPTSTNGRDKEQAEKRYWAGEAICTSVLTIAGALEVDGWKSVGVWLAKNPDRVDELHAAAHKVAEAIGSIEAMAIT